MKKTVKLIAINFLVFVGLLFIFNASAILIYRIHSRINVMKADNYDRRSILPNYHNVSWAKTHFNEFNNLPSEYRSYVGWRRLPYKGQTVNIDSNGIRFTPQSPKVTSLSPKVIFLGGSTTWGTGSNDSTTIPSFFSKIANGEYAAVNLGESNYNAFQSFLFLKLQIIKGLKPSIIISYDGVNNGYVPGKRMFSHNREQQIIDVMKNQDRNNVDESVMHLDNFIKPLKVFVNRYLKRPGTPVKKAEVADSFQTKRDIETATELLESWLSIKHLADENHSQFIAILQPNPFVGKPKIDYLTFNKADSIRYSYYPYVFQLLKEEKYKELSTCVLNYSDKFNREECIYIDDCHVSPNGNAIIAESIYKDVLKIVAKPGKTTWYGN